MAIDLSGEKMKSLLFLTIFCISIFSFGNEILNLCPIVIMPAKAIGPFTLLSKLESIKKQFPDAEITTYADDLKNGKTAYVDYKGFHISYHKDFPHDVWIDLKNFPENCLFYKGKNISPRAPVQAVRKLMGGCKKMIPRDGGVFYECEKGLKIGIISNSSNKKYVDQIRIGRDY